ncbi:hypothetical protein QTN25_006360 [Entamoeba marina]
MKHEFRSHSNVFTYYSSHIKFLFIGDEEVGKTPIIKRLVEDEFSEDNSKPHYGDDNVIVNETTVYFKFQENNRDYTHVYSHVNVVVVVVFDFLIWDHSIMRGNGQFIWTDILVVNIYYVLLEIHLMGTYCFESCKYGTSKYYHFVFSKTGEGINELFDTIVNSSYKLINGEEEPEKKTNRKMHNSLN